MPFSAGGYFDKIACFCFELQVLGPGERVDMPVSFYVDPAMLDDRGDAGRHRHHALLHHVPRPTCPEEDAAAAGNDARLAAASEARGRTIEQ